MEYVLITGAAGGMGKAAAQLLTENGYFVIALDKSFPDDFKENILCSVNDSLITVCADVTDEKSIYKALSETSAVTDHLSAIIHFAGIYVLDSLAEMENDVFDKIFDVNLKGAFLVNKIFLPLLKKGSKIIITTSELANLDPLPFTGLYAVTKSALDKYAYSLAMELQLLGISVSVLRAGAVGTKMLGVSTDALDKFCRNTKLYTCNAKRFKNIVEGVESRHIHPAKIAKKTIKILRKKHPCFAYSINRNPLLVLLNILPKRLQLWIIKMILK